LFTAESAFGFRDLHAFACPGADEVGFEFGDHGQDIEEESSDGVGGVMDGPADAELCVPFDEVFDDVQRIGQGPGEPVEFGDDEGMPARTAARASRSPGRSLFLPVSPWST
jgi:hypothetical protein